MVQSTDDFLTNQKDFDFNSNQFLVSYDVKSLFTNIPLSYTNNIIADYMYSPHHKEHPPIKKIIIVSFAYTLFMLLPFSIWIDCIEVIFHDEGLMIKPKTFKLICIILFCYCCKNVNK